MRNPELQRLAWLHLRPGNIAFLAVPVLLVLVVGLEVEGYFMVFERSDASAMWLNLLCTGLAGLLLCVIAPYAVAGTVISEIRWRTWDWQRLSALDAWNLTWGKLVGGSARCWIAAMTPLALGFGATIVASGGSPLPITMVVVIGVFAQALSLVASLIMVRLGNARRGEAALCAVVGILGGATIASRLGDWTQSVNIQGLNVVPGEWIALLAMAVSAGLVVAGAWRLTQAELRVPAGNGVWLAILLWVALLATGLPDREVLVTTGGRYIFGAIHLMVLALVAALLTPMDTVTVRRTRDRLTLRSIGTPEPWLLAALATAVLLAVFLVVTVAMPGRTRQVPFNWVPPLTLAALLVRDLAIIHFFKLRADAPKGAGAGMLAIFVVWTIVPSVLGYSAASYSPPANLALMTGAATNPLMRFKLGAGITPLVLAGLQAGFMVWLVGWQLRQAELPVSQGRGRG